MTYHFGPVTSLSMEVCNFDDVVADTRNLHQSILSLPTCLNGISLSVLKKYCIVTCCLTESLQRYNVTSMSHAWLLSMSCIELLQTTCRTEIHSGNRTPLSGTTEILNWTSHHPICLYVIHKSLELPVTISTIVPSRVAHVSHLMGFDSWTNASSSLISTPFIHIR